jgi:prepilin-type N-terminal cleavage/methylation domain-containing protein
MRPAIRRDGYTLIEMMVVLAILIILGSVLVPTINGAYGNSRQKASADMLQTRMREARAKAMETGVWYRLAISGDNKKMRLAPDCQDFDSLTTQVIEESFEKGVTAEVSSSDATQSVNSLMYQSTGTPESSSSQSGPTSSWTTIATFGPEGICREGLVTVLVKEGKFNPITIQVRGIVGTSSVVPTKNGGAK